MKSKEAIDILLRNTNLGYGIIIEGDTKEINEALSMGIMAIQTLCGDGCKNCRYDTCPIGRKNKSGRRTSMVDKAGKEFDGYINKVILPDGKVYKLQCEVVEIYPMQCPRCGGRVELKYGSGDCQSCGTVFTTQFKISEV